MPLACQLCSQKYRARSRCVINPEATRWLPYWDTVTAGCMMFVCFVTPYEVAYIAPKSVLEPLFFINRIVDVTFIVDMILQFFVTYTVYHRFGAVIIKDQRSIAKHYLRSWFALDLVSVLPFDVVGLMLDSKALAKLKIMRVVRLVRLLKLIRLLRGMRLIRRWELEMAFSYRKVTLTQLLVVVIVAAHWMSCALGLIDTVSGGTCLGPDESQGCMTTWLTEAALEIVGQGSSMTPLRSYIVGLYTASTIIVHSHASPPTNDAERIFFTIFIFIGGFVWTRIIAKSIAITTSMNRHQVNYQQTMDDLNVNAAELGLPGELQKRLRDYFRHTRDHWERRTWKELVNLMPPLLQREVQFQINRSWLTRVGYLSVAPRILQARLALKLTTHFYAQHDVFGCNFMMYILGRGVAGRRKHNSSSKISRDKDLMVITAGSVWGEDHLLLNAVWLLTPNTTTALDFAEVLCLARRHFEHVVRAFPSYQLQLRKYYVRTLVVRGILYKAKQERKTTNWGERRQTITDTSLSFYASEDFNAFEEFVHQHNISLNAIKNADANLLTSQLRISGHSQTTLNGAGPGQEKGDDSLIPCATQSLVQGLAANQQALAVLKSDVQDMHAHMSRLDRTMQQILLLLTEQRSDSTAVPTQGGVYDCSEASDENSVEDEDMLHRRVPRR